MKTVVFFAIGIFLLFSSCSKEDKENLAQMQGNLDISLSTDNTLGVAVGQKDEVFFYPNPFLSGSCIHSSDGQILEKVIISDENNDFKVFTNVQTSTFFNFGNCKKGTYYAEVLLNGKLYRFELIKMED